MVDLANGECRITMLFEVLGHGKRVRIHLTHGSFEIPATSGLGAQSGHEAGAGSATNSDLTIGALKKSAPRGESVDIWRMDVLVPVTIEFGAEVVDRDEEDIEFLG